MPHGLRMPLLYELAGTTEQLGRVMENGLGGFTPVDLSKMLSGQIAQDAARRLLRRSAI